MTLLSLEIVISTLDIVHTRKTAPATLRTPKPTQKKYTPNHIYTHTHVHTLAHLADIDMEIVM